MYDSTVEMLILKHRIITATKLLVYYHRDTIYNSYYITVRVICDVVCSQYLSILPSSTSLAFLPEGWVLKQTNGSGCVYSA